MYLENYPSPHLPTVSTDEPRIKKPDHHFFVLNSPNYYAQTLSHADLQSLYRDFRSVLAHNASIGVGKAILLDPTDDHVFPTVDGKLATNLAAFHNRSVSAVEAFLASGLAEKSLAAEEMRAKQ